MKSTSFSEQMICVSLLAVLLSNSLVWGRSAPSTWSLLFPVVPELCLTGQNQAPIDLDTEETRSSRLTRPLLSEEFFNSLGDILVENTGTTVDFEFGEGLEVSRAGLPGTFRAEGLHFHFGADSSEGSEHTVDGEPFPMEMHVVMVNERFASLEEALESRDGLAVLAFFFEEGDFNRDFETIVKTVGAVPNKGDTTTLDGLVVRDLLSDNLRSFFRYFGSLTTPPCSEAVTWSVFSRPIEVSESQLERFRNSVNLNSGARRNFRPTQDLNGRTVRTSRRLSDDDD